MMRPHTRPSPAMPTHTSTRHTTNKKHIKPHIEQRLIND